MDEKKKKNQPVEPEPALSCKNVVALIAIIVSLVILSIPCRIFITFGLPDYYREIDVLSTCEQLHLSPDGEFCRNLTRSQPDDLEATLLNEYPLHETSISELVERWDVQFELVRDSCEKPITTTTDNPCPIQSDCGEYACWANVHVEDGVTIRVDSQGMVIGYRVPPID